MTDLTWGQAKLNKTLMREFSITRLQSIPHWQPFDDSRRVLNWFLQGFREAGPVKVLESYKASIEQLSGANHDDTKVLPHFYTKWVEESFRPASLLAYPDNMLLSDIIKVVKTGYMGVNLTGDSGEPEIDLNGRTFDVGEGIGSWYPSYVDYLMFNLLSTIDVPKDGTVEFAPLRYGTRMNASSGYFNVFEDGQIVGKVQIMNHLAVSTEGKVSDKVAIAVFEAYTKVLFDTNLLPFHAMNVKPFLDTKITSLTAVRALLARNGISRVVKGEVEYGGKRKRVKGLEIKESQVVASFSEGIVKGKDLNRALVLSQVFGQYLK